MLLSCWVVLLWTRVHKRRLAGAKGRRVFVRCSGDPRAAGRFAGRRSEASWEAGNDLRGSTVSRIQETRHQFREDLIELERQAVDGLEMVSQALHRALESVIYQDVELAGMAVAEGDGIERRCLEIQQTVVTLLARQAPVAGDLRLVAALMHITRCIERIGNQCVNIAKLVPLSGHEPPKDKDLLDAVKRMGHLAHSSVSHAKDAFAERKVALAKDLARQDEEINRLNREIFGRAVEIGDDKELREWGMFMILVARCLERVGDNAVEIAEQTEFVVTGAFREPADASKR